MARISTTPITSAITSDVIRTKFNTLVSRVNDLDAEGTVGGAGGGGDDGGAPFLIVASATALAAIKARADYVCDGVADQVEINAALAALPSTPNTYSATTTGGGGVLLVGSFHLSAPIVNTNDHVSLLGVFGSTILFVDSGFVGTTVITFNRDAQSRNLLYCAIDAIRIRGGDFLNSISGAITGLDWNVADGKPSRIIVSQMSGPGIVHRGQTADVADQTEWIACRSYSNGSYGFWAKTRAQDNRMSLCEFHENDDHGAFFEAGAWTTDNCMTWGNLGNGVCISGPQSQMWFSGWKIEQNNGGFYTVANAGGPSNVFLNQCEIGSNSWSGDDTYDDINLQSGANVYLVDCCIVKPYSNVARYGLKADGCTNVQVNGGLIASAASFGTAQVNTSINGVNLQIRVLRNYNPLGLATVTVSGSPLTITAGNTPETIYVRGGTVSSVTKSGNQIAGATDAAILLDPGEACIVTYSSAPTIWRDRR